MTVQKRLMSTSMRNDVLDAVAYLIAKSHGLHVSASATAWSVSVLEKFVLQWQQQDIPFEDEV